MWKWKRKRKPKRNESHDRMMIQMLEQIDGVEAAVKGQRDTDRGSGSTDYS